jgi:hypothetical protein
MTTFCRPTTVADEERLIEFLTRAFATDRRANFLSSAMLRWKYWDPRGDFAEPRSFVMERDGQIIAHVGLWPVTVRTGARVEHGIHAMDWAAAPQAPGAGVTLLMRLTERYDFVYGMGGSEITRTILPQLGFHTVAEALTWARPLRPWEQILKHQSRDLRLPLRLGRNVWWSRRPSTAVPHGWVAVEPSAGRIGELVALASERDESFFAYLQKCPVARSLTFHIENDGRKAGFFVLFVVGEQARVAGMWLENPSPEIWRIAFQLAQDAALKHTNASEIAARCTTEAGAIGAGQAGMRLRERIPVMLFRRDCAHEPLPLQHQLCDSDAIFRVDQPTEFLT